MSEKIEPAVEVETPADTETKAEPKVEVEVEADTETKTEEEAKDPATIIEELQSELKRWKGFSKKHEDEAKALKKEKAENEKKEQRHSLLTTITAEFELPAEAEEFLTAETESDLRAQAEKFSKLFGGKKEETKEEPNKVTTIYNPLQGKSDAENRDTSFGAQLLEAFN